MHRPARPSSRNMHYSYRRHRRRRLSLEMLECRRVLAAGNGLQGQYYASNDFTGEPLSVIDTAIDHDWAAGSPLVGFGRADDFTVRWSGQVEARFTELHQFIITASDGARLWVNGQLLVDQLDSTQSVQATHVVSLIAGRRYDFQLEFREQTGTASIMLEWSAPSLPREVIPTSQLFAAQRGSVQQQQWNDVPGNTVVDLIAWSTFPNSPDSSTLLPQFETASNTGDQSGRRLRGFIYPPISGPYQFLLAADEAAELRLSLTSHADDAQTIASLSSPTAPRQWDAQPSQRSPVVYLQAGQAYYIEALTKELTGDDHLAVAWLRPDRMEPEVIPGDVLSPVLPEVQLYAIQPRIAEGSPDPARLQIVRRGDSTALPLEVRYALSGSASAGSDYQPLSGIATIPAGQTSIELTVDSLSDGATEGDEEIIVELQAGPGYQVQYKSERTALVTINDDQPPPTGAESLWNGQSLGNFIHYGGSFTTINDPNYGEVIQATIPAGQIDPWSSALLQAIDAPVDAGDIVLLDFRVRSIGGPAQFVANFELGGDPYTKSLSQGIPVSETWQRIQLPFAVVESYGAGAANLTLHLGATGAIGQTLQFAQLQLLNYGPPRTVSPETSFDLNLINGVHGTAQRINVLNQPFQFAYQVQTTSVPNQYWHLQAVERNDVAVHAGSVMRFEFSVRAIAGVNPLTNFALQRTDTWATLSSQTFVLSDQWQSYSIDVTLNETFVFNSLQVAFSLGYGLQTVEFGGFHWTNLSATVDLADLPKQFPASTYGGRSGDAAWREEAEQQIADQRMASLTVLVVDANNQPLDGATIGVRQQRHAFKFGSAINAYDGKLAADANEVGQKYQSEIKRLFNTAVLENSIKWPGFLENRQRAIDGAEFATNNDLYLRGHNMLWPSRTYMPGSVWSEYDSRAANLGSNAANAWLKSTIELHIEDLLNTFDGVITEWDVVNEPFTNRDVMDLLGDAILLEWYQQIRDFDPNILLTLNDYSIFTRNGTDTAHRSNFETWLDMLESAGLLDIIGVQGHFNDATLTDMNVLRQLIEQYDNQFDASIAITEFDINSTDRQLQADYLRDFMTMIFSQSSITEFVQWGFWENAHWYPDAALYNSDFSIRPNGQAFEDLVFGRWWSDQLATSQSGGATLDVFQGEYEVVVQYQGQSYSSTAVVASSGNVQVTVQVNQTPRNLPPLLEVEQSLVQGVVASPLSTSGRWRDPEGSSVLITASVGQVQVHEDGTWTWSFTSTDRILSQSVVVSATDSQGATVDVQFELQATTAILSRGIVYADSAFGNAADPSKVALLPGETSGVDNFSNYALGLNRIVIDIAGLAQTDLTEADFEFRVGNSHLPKKWLKLTATSQIPLPGISVQTTPTPGVQRIHLDWPDHAIENQWLRVEVRSTAKTGLVASDLFYFGNQVADVNGDVNLNNQIRVDKMDATLIRQRQSSEQVGIDSPFDIDRSGYIDATDLVIARMNQQLDGGLLMFTAPIDDSQDRPGKPPIAPPNKQSTPRSALLDRQMPLMFMPQSIHDVRRKLNATVDVLLPTSAQPLRREPVDRQAELQLVALPPMRAQTNKPQVVRMKGERTCESDAPTSLIDTSRLPSE